MGAGRQGYVATKKTRTIEPVAKSEPSRFHTNTPGKIPTYSGHRLRQLAAAGRGELQAHTIAVARLMRVGKEDLTKPLPRKVATLADITQGLGLDSETEQRIQRLVSDTLPTFNQKTQTQRIFHARGRLLSTLRDSMQHVDSGARDEILKRAVAYWKHHHQTDYGKAPTVRFEGGAMRKSGPKLVVPLEKGAARGGKYYRRVPKPGGGYRYYYTREQYLKQHEHRNGDEEAKQRQSDKQKAYLAKLAGSKEALQKAIDAGVLKGSVTQHLSMAEHLVGQHSKGLKPLLNDLTSMAPEGAKVKGRVKTVESVLGKLVRKPKYGDASKLQDLTGARVVVDSLSGVRDTVTKIRDKYTVVDEDNYIDTPQGDYRSWHLIIQDGATAKEIQVRTGNQNTFADWSHNVYKPRTPEQTAKVKAAQKTIDTYSKAMSAHFFSKDKGDRPPNPPAPPCPPVVKEAVGCIS